MGSGHSMVCGRICGWSAYRTSPVFKKFSHRLWNWQRRLALMKCASNMVEMLQLHGDVLIKNDLIRLEQQRVREQGEEEMQPNLQVINLIPRMSVHL
jgi:hypothetical protein